MGGGETQSWPKNPLNQFRLMNLLFPNLGIANLEVQQILFARLPTKHPNVVGTKWAFLAAVLLIIAWAASGPAFHYSDTWQLVVNTATTVVTFLIVFLIQNTQNRDARAIHLKLDEIIRSIERAQNEMIHIEKLSDEELEAMTQKFEKIRREYESRGTRTETRVLESGAAMEQKTSD